MARYEMFWGGEWKPFPKHREYKYGEEFVETDEYNSPEQAVGRWADVSDHYGDFAIVGGEDGLVAVREIGVTDWKLYRVEGEAVPQYSAKEEDVDNLTKWERSNAFIPGEE